MPKLLIRTFSVLSRSLALILTVIAVTATAIGWLYWFRAGVSAAPGPRVQDTLPLDELPIHAAVPLIVVLPTFGVAAVLLGLVARKVSLDRIGGALTLFIATGAVVFLLDAVSVFLVRQVGFSDAFRAAAGNETVYLAAALSGLAGALLCAPPRRGDRWASTLVVAVAAAGGVDLIAAVAPRTVPYSGLLAQVAPTFVPHAVHALVIPLGVALLISARGLARRNRRAWLVALGLAATDAVIHLLAGPDFIDTVFATVLVLLLVAGRREFSAPGDPTAHPRALRRLIGVTVISVAYAAIALAVNRMASDLPVRPTSDVVAALRSLVGFRPPSRLLLRGDFSSWFPISSVLLFTSGLAWAFSAWFSPWRHLHAQRNRSDERALRIVAQYGDDTLAPFALRSDKSHYFYVAEKGMSPGGREVLIAYRVVRGVALISGDPIGPPELIPDAMRSFMTHAALRSWQVAVLGASRRYLDTYRQLGMRTLYHGDEAIIDVPTFTLAGGKMKSVRQATHRVARQGFTVQITKGSEIPESERAELIAVEAAWLNERPRTGFVMELDSLFGPGSEDAVFVIGRNSEGRVKGFLHVAVCPTQRKLSLSSMPRQPDTPNGFNSWLITEAVDWARAQHYDALSLNFSPFAGLLGQSIDLSPTQRLEREVLRKLKQILSLQLDNLLLFNQQFNPGWEPRFVAFPHRSGLPRIVLAAMAAENYLPLAERMRGSEWTDGEVSTTEAARHLVGAGHDSNQS